VTCKVTATSSPGAGGEPDGVVEEDLVRPDLDEQRRQATQVGEHRAD